MALAPTHYVPALCERNGRQEKAACGKWLWPSDVRSFEPTCPECSAYLVQEADPVEQAEMEQSFGIRPAIVLPTSDPIVLASLKTTHVDVEDCGGRYTHPHCVADVFTTDVLTLTSTITQQVVATYPPTRWRRATTIRDVDGYSVAHYENQSYLAELRRRTA